MFNKINMVKIFYTENEFTENLLKESEKSTDDSDENTNTTTCNKSKLLYLFPLIVLSSIYLYIKN